MADKPTICRMVHYRLAGGDCVPAIIVREIRDREGMYAVQLFKGWTVDGVIVRKEDLHEELAWHWPKDCPQGR